MVLFFPMDSLAISHTFEQTRPITTLCVSEGDVDDEGCDGCAILGDRDG